ncbi:MAG TPA: carboxypeptidase regulatory-like domain-containing protein [Candidatus Acidoferrum sp.]|nr:carboxypeptidase regulatory-like domain-containing protein [Candidatus Acidoferrum sp.]
MKRFTAGVCVLALVAGPIAAQENSKGQTKIADAREASATNSAESTRLPVRRVVLYKNGVGYFEHLGRVRGSQDVHVDFTSAQLNDVLKSLTVLDLSGGRITGVDYNSEAPLARRLATLRLALGERPTVAEFLGALRGARVEIRNGAGAPITGKLLSVEKKTRMGTAGSVEMEQISLISDAGEVRNVDLNTNTSVRIVDHDLNTEVGKYLGLVASAREQDVRRMTISTTGNGERNLYVSYISEVPIWKTTYRIVLPSKEGKKPLLQGWAIVDNTVGEDWNDVELSLVAGAPHSFIQQLSEPYYGRRPVVPLPESVQLSPQTHASTLLRGNGGLSGTVTDSSGATVPNASVVIKDQSGAIVAQTTTDSDGDYIVSSLPPGNYRAEFGANGFKTNAVNAVNVGSGENALDSTLQVGTASQMVEVTANATALETQSASFDAAGGGKLSVANRAHIASLPMNGRNFNAVTGMAPGAMAAPAPPPPTSNAIAEAREMGSAAASGQGLGDLFEYKLKDRVTLKKNQSALVPIVQTDIEAEKVSLWSGTSGSGRPLRAIWMKNTSALTLDGGSFNVLESEVFAGEGLTDPIKPGEKRLLSYATDLGLLVEAKQNASPQHVTKVKMHKGTMTQVSEEQQRTTYTVRNQDSTPRVLVIEHPARLGWNFLKNSKQPEEQAPGTSRFRMDVASNTTAMLPVEEVHPLFTTYQISNLTDDQVLYFSKQGSITPEMTDALKKISTQKAVVAKLEQEMEDRQKDIDRIVDDQGRLRENMKALRGSAEEKALLQRYTKQLDDQETQLAVLRKKIQDTEAQRDSENEKLENMIDGLDLESTLP